MRFLLRGLIGLVLFAVMVTAVGFGAYRLHLAMQSDGNDGRRPPRERSYTVNVATLTAETLRPVTTAYGQIESWRTLQIRASSDGRLVDATPKFRDGAFVRKGDLLVRIDPADAEFALLDAEAALADAEAQKAEAEEAVVGAEQELVAARKQLDLRTQALGRQKQLLGKGYSTMVQVEQEELSVAALEQALSNRLQSVITARKRIERMDLTVARAKIAVQDAERTLAETTIAAPFDGYLDKVDATLGRRVTPTETLAELIDPMALEARFTLSTREFSRFLDTSGNLVDAPVTVRLELGERVIEVPGHLDRAAAVVAEGDAGRTLFAGLDVEAGTALRPGDFITVRVEEPALENVARVPASAVAEDGRILIVGEDDRLTEIKATVLRRMAGETLIAGVPFGSDYVRERLPHLGTGLKVRPNRVDDKPGEVGEAAGRKPDEGKPRRRAPQAGGDQEMVTLEPERRAKLIDILEGSNIPEHRKERLRKLLNAPKVPLSLVERIERRQGRSG